MMLEAGNLDGACPQDVLALIPWYPDGPITEAERGAVEAHAASCGSCREEIHALLGDLDAAADVNAPAAAAVLARALDRIELSDAARRATQRAATSAVPLRPATAARRRLSRRIALAATLALAAGTGVLATLALPRVFGDLAYYTAASPETARAAGPLLEMIPREDVSVAELRTALRSIEGELVAGPVGTLGRYRVRLPAGADAAAAAALLRAEEGGIASYAEALHP